MQFNGQRFIISAISISQYHSEDTTLPEVRRISIESFGLQRVFKTPRLMLKSVQHKRRSFMLLLAGFDHF